MRNCRRNQRDQHNPNVSGSVSSGAVCLGRRPGDVRAVLRAGAVTLGLARMGVLAPAVLASARLSAAVLSATILSAAVLTPAGLAPAALVAQVTETDPSPGSLEVWVTDGESGSPLAATTVRIRTIDRSAVTDAAGLATIENLPPRDYAVVVERIGFMPEERTVGIRSGERSEIEIELVSSPIQLSTVVVTGTGRERGLDQVYRPTTSLSGAELQRSMGSSVPATLSAVPGFSVQYNGPGASSPSIRGMSGDRVLMLEDGQRTGDLYQSASDHGVMVEPLSAQRMEVVRGPAGLIYGSNALGGVVNVIRDDVPRSRPSALTATLSTQFESVSPGGGGALVVSAPAGPLSVRGEISGRGMSDTETPLGTLEETSMSVFNGALGASRVSDWGFAGLAVRHYENRYGVPGEFNGELIPGGHPGGVNIEAARTTGRFRAAYQRPVLGFFESVEVDASVTRYLHDEIEGTIDGHDILGAHFDQMSIDANVRSHHEHTLDELRVEGAVGVSVLSRDLEASGLSPGTRSGAEWSISGFGYEEFGRGPFRVQTGLRYDHLRINPGTLDSLVVRTDQGRRAKEVTDRDFGAFSASAAALWEFYSGWTVGASLARAHRTPSIEELYSEGPHLADFSFDVGSPGLEPEVGLGGDLFLRANRPDLSVELAAFVNRVDGFIHYVPTGETVRVIREGSRPRTTPVFEAVGVDADFSGAEGRVQWEVRNNVVLDATASYTRASRRDDGDPLPFIPPLSGQFEVRYEGSSIFGSAGIDFAAAQHRVPRAIEVGDLTERPQTPTDGHGLLNLALGWRGDAGGLNHSVTVQAKNLTNREWRDHLSRIKDIAPQPGRNVQVTYRLHY